MSHSPNGALEYNRTCDVCWRRLTTTDDMCETCEDHINNKEQNMETETTTTVIKNQYPQTMSRRHMANIIDYCADRAGLASWGAELSLLFRNGDATALDACQYFIDALNGTVDDVAWYSLDLNYNLTVTHPTEEEN